MRPESSLKDRVGLLQFPGSNCDQDCIDSFKNYFNIDLVKIWHGESSLPKIDGLIIPGGFSYGDYLRGGSLASHSPLMSDVATFVKNGGAVLGICNGFQILTESHLLPGILLRNDKQKFVCRYTNLKLGEGDSIYHKKLANKSLRIPVAHGEGRYFCSQDELKNLQDSGRVVFRYVDDDGQTTDSANPNGSLNHIAGICSENGRVLGMMPHPERACDQLLGGSDDGKLILETFLASFL